MNEHIYFIRIFGRVLGLKRKTGCIQPGNQLATRWSFVNLPGNR